MDQALINAAIKTANSLGCTPATLLAVVEVESAGRIFVSINGKQEPVIRFEGHWFDRRLDGTDRARARLQGLASPKVGIVKNPASQTGRWELLERASRINREAALESTSWGLAQVMGGHWKWLGYPSVDAMVESARAGLTGQLELMARYIEKAGLISSLATQDWTRFAIGYNGPNAIKQGYAAKLRTAFQHWNTHTFDEIPVLTAGDKPVTKSPEFMREGMAGDAVSTLQSLLSANGYPCGASGKFDALTVKSVRLFQKENGLKVDGVVGPQTWGELQIATGQPNPFTSLFILVTVFLKRFF